eukprot:Lankesteria_metandrocarpae@DN4739_c0_g2_i1.p1
MSVEVLRVAISGTAKVGVLGLGYVGLPLVRALTDAGFVTMGFDTDDEKVRMLQNGQSYIRHISESWIQSVVEKKLFVPTNDMGSLHVPDAIIICVPTPLTGGREPDLSYVIQTAENIAKVMRPGQLVVLESSTYPGTTRNVVLPILLKSGLKLGEDFCLAYSPEREDPGNPQFDTKSIPKIVGGVDDKSGEMAELIYSRVVKSVVRVDNCEIAEAAKILENTYRSVSIAMVNEMKILLQRMGIDIWKVIDAAKTKPFGFQAFYPGPGLGGHCIPIDPFYLTYLAKKYEMPTRFIELAGEINSSMPHYVISQTMEALNDKCKSLKGSRVCVLGVSYKKDVDDSRESPSFKILELLKSKGAEVHYNDPYFPVLPAARRYSLPAMTSSDLSESFLKSIDCLIVSADHSSYDYKFILDHTELIIDTRNVFDTFASSKVVKA